MVFCKYGEVINMIYPSADKLNKIGSKYKLISMAATRSKQIKAGMKPLIETTSTNPLTIAFEEIAAGVITANIEDIDEVPVDYTELARSSTIFESADDSKRKSDSVDDEESADISWTEAQLNVTSDDGIDKAEIADQFKHQAPDIDDTRVTGNIDKNE